LKRIHAADTTGLPQQQRRRNEILLPIPTSPPMKLAGPAGNPESLPARAGQFLPNFPQIGSDTLRADPSRVSPGVPSGCPCGSAIIAIPRRSPSRATAESRVQRPPTDSREAVRAMTASFENEEASRTGEHPNPLVRMQPGWLHPPIERWPSGFPTKTGRHVRMPGLSQAASERASLLTGSLIHSAAPIAIMWSGNLLYRKAGRANALPSRDSSPMDRSSKGTTL
jgi:hypothetical protein